MIFKKKVDVQLFDICKNNANYKLQMHGYGENSAMGKFLIEGQCEVVHFSEFVEKAGLKVERQEQQEPIFMKLKIGKFTLNKRYVDSSLKQLLEDKIILRKFQSQNQIPAKQSQQAPSQNDPSLKRMQFDLHKQLLLQAQSGPQIQANFLPEQGLNKLEQLQAV